ncbi:3-oxoacyl-ACP reductase FabG [Acidaminobacter sp.]|uniref:3-oxoacyl-ACP reductase FabG n=1 Tax=Acidaminobacter sp. TaxID=1872102 RepID=UPI00255F4B23|nr:3-oxoacyl-ACP reductase FabG [Acidaminobacter sp.]MDK9711139.1 3-oxoacyl-ACP reductase FabG [Acidaminobacter sp.]
MRLEGKVAIVTGSARGLGKAIVARLAKEGAKVVVTDLDQAGCDAVVDEIKAAGGEAMAVACNVTDRIAVQALAASTLEYFGKIDILVNNAGITKDATLKKMTDDQWDAVINVNLKSVFICTQEISKYMVEQKSGRVISMSSLAGVEGNFGQTNYSASKAGVIGMTKTWSKELGKNNVTANVIAPGFMNTEMTKTIPQNIVDQMLSRIPVGRMGEPEEIAAAVVYLASDEAGFVNGVTLNINGGMYVM